MTDKTIALGRIDDKLYTLTLDKDVGMVTYDEYSDDIFDSDTGEERARDYLTDDTEMWKLAVEGDNTTKGLDDWVEEVISVDGWEHVLGSDNIHEIAWTDYYAEEHDDGHGLPEDDYEMYDQIIFETEDEFKELVKAVNENDKQTLEKIFNSLPELSTDTLREFV